MKKLLITIQDIVPSSPDFEVVGVFNAGCTEFNGKTMLLLRIAERVKRETNEYLEIPVLDTASNQIVKKRFDYSDENFNYSDVRIIKGNGITYLTSMSHFRLAESIDGVNFVVPATPTILPEGEYEVNGIEDPRITNINGEYFISYACSSTNGILTGVIKTTDFSTFNRLGYAFHPDNKDMVIFPKIFGNNYLCLHRPSTTDFGKRSIWLAQSPDMVCWGNHLVVANPRPGFFDSERVGAGAPPILIEEGWLEIYHGANENNEYAIGALLLDKDDPTVVIARSIVPIISATEDYEKCGFFPNVVFTCGLTERNGVLSIYYGASDQSIAVETISVAEVLANIYNISYAFPAELAKNHYPKYPKIMI